MRGSELNRHEDRRLVGDDLIKIFSYLLFWLVGGVIYYFGFRLGVWTDKTEVDGSAHDFLFSILDKKTLGFLVGWSIIVISVAWFLGIEEVYRESLAELVRIFYIAGTFVPSFAFSYWLVHRSVIVDNSLATKACMALIGVGFAVNQVFGRIFLYRKKISTPHLIMVFASLLSMGGAVLVVIVGVVLIILVLALSG